MLHAAGDTLSSPARATKTVNEKQCCLHRSYPSTGHRDHAREVLTEPRSTEWKPSLHETRAYCLDSADSAQCSHSDAVTATRREGEGETREDRREGRGDFPTSHWDLFSGGSLHLPSCPFMEKWEGLITQKCFFVFFF